VNFATQSGRPDVGNSLLSGLRVLRRRWLTVVGVVGVCLVVSLVQHERASKTYKASANVTFQSSSLASSVLGVSGGGVDEPQREAATNVLVAHSPEVAAQVRKELNTSEEVNSLLDEVSVEAQPNADVLTITASTPNARGSALLANAFADQYIAFETNSQLASITAAETRFKQQLAALSSESPERATLQKSLQRLNELRALAGGTSQIIGRARPPAAPSGTTTRTAALLGIVVGLALAFSLLFVMESLDKRIKTIEEFEEEYRLPALTGVPQSSFRNVLAAERTEFLEPYRILRSALDLAAVTRQLESLLVTSAVSGEGKTGVAVDLAHAIALTGRRVVLVEIDLRRPTVGRHLGLPAGNGLTKALMRPDSLSELLVEPFPELPNFTVLPSGLRPPNPAELLGSSSLAELISELMSSDGIVILDAPPLLPVADTQELLNKSIVHGTIVVARAGKTTRDEVRRARMILNRHMVEPIGLVVTGLRELNRYGYDVDPATTSGDPRTARVIDTRPEASSLKLRELRN
jgi:capsular exopolysaccharide synthesis family protein